MRKVFFLLFFGPLMACTPFVTSTPRPSPQPVRVVFTSTLRPWVEILHQCALENPKIALITEETSAADLEFTSADLTLWFGEPPHGIPDYAASLGMDEIIIIAGSEVALRNINADQLQVLFTEPDPAYQVWTYSEGNELRAIFDNAVLGDASLSSYTLLAPNPAAMIEAIAADPMAIGYVPNSWLSGNVQIISIERDLQAAFEHPVLALANAEPEENLRSYLVCLQNAAP